MQHPPTTGPSLTARWPSSGTVSPSTSRRRSATWWRSATRTWRGTAGASRDAPDLSRDPAGTPSPRVRGEIADARGSLPLRLASDPYCIMDLAMARFVRRATRAISGSLVRWPASSSERWRWARGPRLRAATGTSSRSCCRRDRVQRGLPGTCGPSSATSRRDGRRGRSGATVRARDRGVPGGSREAWLSGAEYRMLLDNGGEGGAAVAGSRLRDRSRDRDRDRDRVRDRLWTPGPARSGLPRVQPAEPGVANSL